MIVFVNSDVCVVAKWFHVSMLYCVMFSYSELYFCVCRTLILVAMCSSLWR